jgi:hypothetical protein
MLSDPQWFSLDTHGALKVVAIAGSVAFTLRATADVITQARANSDGASTTAGAVTVRL